jgi:hypothetical protein
MDASTFRALALVLRMEESSAVQDALQQMERARMHAADLESRGVNVVQTLYVGYRILDTLERHAMTVGLQQDVDTVQRALGRALTGVGIDRESDGEMEGEDDEGDEMSD